MIYKIADFYIEINTIFNSIDNLCKKYLADSCATPDFTVSTTRDDIKYEKNASLENGDPLIPYPHYYEPFAVYRKICAEVLKRNAFLMHGAVIEYEGNGYIFTAPSGTGKTTHIRLWQKVFGEDKVTIINGDKPLIRFIDGDVYAYGTPWCGKEGYNENARVPLKGICIVTRSEKDSILPLSSEEAIPALFSQIMICDSADLSKQLELLNDFIEKVPVYRLECTMNENAALVAYNGLMEGIRGKNS